MNGGHSGRSQEDLRVAVSRCRRESWCPGERTERRRISWAGSGESGSSGMQRGVGLVTTPSASRAGGLPAVDSDCRPTVMQISTDTGFSGRIVICLELDRELSLRRTEVRSECGQWPHGPCARGAGFPDSAIADTLVRVLMMAVFQVRRMSGLKS